MYQNIISWGSTLLKMKPTSYTDFVYINTGGLTGALPGDGQRCAIIKKTKPNLILCVKE